MNIFLRHLSALFDRRAGFKDAHTLSIKNIYVFFSREGMLFLLLLIITFITGVNYGNNLVLSVFFYLLSVWGISVIITYLQLSKLSIEIMDVKNATAGDVAWVNIRIKNGRQKSISQLQLYFEQAWQDGAADVKNSRKPNYFTVVIPRLLSQEVVRLPVQTSMRGMLNLPRLCIKSQYPLGVVQAWSYVRFAKYAWVYPKPKPFDKIGFSAMQNTDNHSAYAHQAGQDDFDALDNYQQGESLSRVSWAHAARGLGLLSKQFCDTVGQNYVLNYHTMPAAAHEDKLSQLCYALQNLPKHTTFMLILPNYQSPLGQGDAFIKQNLVALAKA